MSGDHNQYQKPTCNENLQVEAMKQAIEALKGYRLETNQAAIKALDQAIEQAEKEKADFEDFVAKVQEVEKEACEIINREWVGLTDHDIHQLRQQGAHSVSDKEFRMIEAKLREKNT